MKHRLSIVIALMSLLLAQGWASRASASEATEQAAPVVQSERSLTEEHKEVRRELGALAQGLETSIKKNDISIAEQLYHLEFHTNSLMVKIANGKFSSAKQKEAALADVHTTLRQVLRLQERVLEHTLAELDRALPGEPHRELWARKGVDLYRPLGRAETPKPGQPAPTRSDAIREMRDGAAEKGAMSQIHYLGPKTINKIKSGELFEWVQVGNRIRFTQAGAKHPVIALEGESKTSDQPTPASVRGAGSGMIFRDASGKIIAAIVSDSSGNYKPGIGSTIGLVQKLEKAGVPSRYISITHVLPGEPVLVKLLLKSKKTMSKDQIKEHVAKLESRVRTEVASLSIPARMAKATSPKTPKSKSPVRAKGPSARARHQRAASKPVRKPAAGRVSARR